MAPQLIYFDIPGLAEASRQTLRAGNIEFEDVRLSREDFQQKKEAGEFPFGQLPVLVLDDGTKVSQSNAILRWAGKQSTLYPSDSTEALRVDEVIDALDDVVGVFRSTFRIEDEAEKKAKQEEAAAGPLIPFLKGLEALAIRNGNNGHLVGSSSTIADIKLTTILSMLTGGFLPGVSTAVLEPFPALLAVKSKHEK